MAVNQRKPYQIEKDRAIASALYLKGRSQMVIAEKLGLTQATISRELKLIREAWQESALVSMDTKKNKELAKIDLLEVQAWDSWEASKKNTVTRITKEAPADKERSQKPGRKKTGTPTPPHPTNGTSVHPDSPVYEVFEKHTKVEEKTGNIVYWHAIMKCVEMRCAILGLNAPVKSQLDVNAKITGFNYVKPKRLEDVQDVPVLGEGVVVEGESEK